MTLKVAIIGRPNVGKSTLFNRLAGRRVAIVHDKPGVTRDRRETAAKLRDMNLQIIDTAGYEYSKEDNLEKRMWEQTKRAISDADVCLFLFDARDGLQPYDEHFAQLLRQMHKPVILLANKCEGKLQEDSIGEAYKLGFGQPIPFSAEHGLGLQDLYEALHEHYKKDEAVPTAETDGNEDNGIEEISEEAWKKRTIQLAIVGRPNVGKSTLVNALLYHCGGKLARCNGIERQGIVHRIDKDTSGLLVCAKDDESYLGLSSQIQQHTVDRFYETVVYGKVKQEEGVIDLPIGRSLKDRKKMAVRTDCIQPDGNIVGAKQAITHYQVLGRYDGFTHLRCRLETGRTHQIRVHLAYLGHPVAGDELYGPKKAIKRLEGQCLHARALGFVHPITGEHLYFESPLPPYFTSFLKTLKPREEE